jgi:hypothetical protein
VGVILHDRKHFLIARLDFCQEASKHSRKFAAVLGYGFCDYVKDLKDLYVALFHFRLGEFDAGFQSLETACTKHETELIHLNVDPQWDAIRSDPRFQSLLRRIGLTNWALPGPRAD